MAKTVFVEILGDASQFKKELTGAVAATNKANTGFSKMKAVAGTAGLALAGVLAIGLEKSAKAAISAQKSTAKLDQAFKDAHLSAGKYAEAVDKAEASGRNLGFTDEETKNTLARLLTATGNVKQAMTDLALAQDVARLKGVDLSTAAQMVTSTLSGNVRAAKALGFVLLPVTTHVDALRAKYKELGEAIPAAELRTAKFADKQATAAEALQKVTERVHGQAQAFSDTAAGGMAQFSAELDHLEVSIGNVLLPVLTSLLTKVNELFVQLNDNLGPALKVVKDAFDKLHGSVVLLKLLFLPVTEALLVWKTEFLAVEAAVKAGKVAFDALKTAASVVAEFFKGVFHTVVSAAHTLVSGFGDAVNGVKSAFNATHSAATTLVAYVKGGLTTAMNAAKPIINGVKSVVSALASALNAVASAAKAVASALSSIHVPHISLPSVGGILSHIPHAAGGSVTAGVSYLVGERGPELFTSGANGFITPNNMLGGGGGTVNVYVAGSVTTERQLVDSIRNAIVQAGNRNGGSMFGGRA